jgi:hypothetical protein
MTLDELLVDGERMSQDLNREYYELGAGLKETPQLEEIYDRYAHVGGDDALDAARGSGSREVLAWALGIRLGRKIASFEERQLAWEQSASITADGTSVPYLRVPIELANSADRAYRAELDDARGAAAAANLNPIREERFEAERNEVATLGVGDYVETIAWLADIDLDALGRQAQTFLADTADMYRDSLARLVKRRLGVEVEELRRSDTSWTFRANEFDAAFDPSKMLDTAVAQMRDMGLDAVQGGRVRVDTEERPRKQPRACCAPVRVPDEVYLVLRPSGGHSDYRTFWHELGHAMHFAAVDPALPFEARWLGDNSVTEGFAMLWDHLTIDAQWLRRYIQLPPVDTGNLVFELAVSELHMLRRYAAKLSYELLFHREAASAPDEYAERLTAATLFRYSPNNYLIDVDPGFYAARYLRAWQLEAGTARTLTERYDEDWWRNPRAGSFVLHLMSRGQADPAHRLARDHFGWDLTFEPCIARLQALLD